LDEVGKAFEHFRARYHDGAEDSASLTTAAAAQWAALRMLATAITDLDESVSRRDSQRIKAALDSARVAIDACQRIDESVHSSGVRMRPALDRDQITPAKRGKAG